MYKTVTHLNLLLYSPKIPAILWRPYRPCFSIVRDLIQLASFSFVAKIRINLVIWKGIDSNNF